jgi:hypothetical protein
MSGKRCHVSFKETVSVIEIPSHRDYNDDTHNSLWASVREIEQDAQRNMIEFHAEGYDWRNAVLEESMHLLPNGELVHPVTFTLLCRMVYFRVDSKMSTGACQGNVPNKSLAIRNLGLRPPPSADLHSMPAAYQ